MSIDTGLFRELQKEIFEIAVSHGWWKVTQQQGYSVVMHNASLVALIHSEVSELLEALRHGNGPSEHIPGGCSSAEEELADIIIRCLDMAEGNGWNVADAILAKVKFNRNRPIKHGGKLF